MKKNEMMAKKNEEKTKKLLILEKILRFMAIGILKKYHPKIVGITGSVGKTSSKEAVFSVLNPHFNSRKNEKNYNNEIGLPLTIIGGLSGGKSLWGWGKIFLRWLYLLIFPARYPKVLILEMGADRPGDIKYLTSFIKCHLAIITDISGSHLEYFKTLANIAKEKFTLADSLPDSGWTILNTDNALIAKLYQRQKNKRKNVLSFGFSEEADVRATDVLYNFDEDGNLLGLSFKLNYKGTSLPIRLKNVLARPGIYAALGAASAGIALGINLVEISKSLGDFSLPCGRMTLFPGIKNTFIIDDTYNSSPVSTIAALQVLGKIKATRKIAVLGDMLELGSDSEEGHKKVAREFVKIGGNILICVGERMKQGAQEVFSHREGKEKVFFFSDPVSAGKYLQQIMRKGDLILVKGSQGMRMEKVVEEVMAEPQKAPELLCRQDTAWKKIPFRK